MISLGKKFKQNSVLFVDSSKTARLIATSNGTDVGNIGDTKRLGKYARIDEGSIEKFFTMIRGKKFTFETLISEEEYHPDIREMALRDAYCARLKEWKSEICEKWDKD